MRVDGCALCREPGGQLLCRTADWRIVLATDAPDFPAFTRVIWNDHVAEMSDLSRPQRAELMQVVFEVEALMRHHLKPEKINLASLGNQVPHVHWHIIARYRGDSHFPAPIWAQAQRQPCAAPDTAVLTAYRAAVQALASP